MADPLTFAYIALAVLVSALIGIGVLAVLVWRDISRHLSRIQTRIEAQLVMQDRSARSRG